MTRTVAVVGGGYGGSLVAKALDLAGDVVLIDPREAFVNAAGSLRALTQPDWAANVFFPFDTLLERGRVICDRATSVDPAGVTLASGDRVEADYLVLATGSGYPFPAKPKQSATTIAEALDDLRESHKELAGAGRVLILGSGPVGLELAGEIKEVWPDKDVTIVGKAEGLLPGFLPEVRAELHRQLDELGITVLLGATLTAPPPTEAGRAGRFTVTTDAGDEISADIWFQAFGVRITSDYLADGKLTPLTARATVPVTGRLTVTGYDHVYALGDIADLPDPKMASYAQEQAQVVAENLRAQLAGERPEAVYTPTPHQRILLPLGPRRGVGQLPAPGGVAPATTEAVHQRKGADLFTARFAERFSRRKASS
ncbi:FAD-dependent oxidoreductase [Microbispora sp. NEAU-D428]|uniref:NAD(P)/FAD-dependent oxidoreductase n=1 Tax=Microbispora sitophila TaxID=2771537 RepID=UPI001866A57A|nr:FAD-dependent oxidoreductase [Microbispora sitophila]MBE3013265.1 FAD-dependent oxidoreductase [Microbispora sitophila]